MVDCAAAGNCGFGVDYGTGDCYSCSVLSFDWTVVTSDCDYGCAE